MWYAIIFYVIITFLAIQYLKMKTWLSNQKKDNQSKTITHYKIQSRPAIENVGFKQAKILFLSSKDYPENDLNSIPHSYSRRQFANLDFIKIPSNMSRIEKYLESNSREVQNKNIHLNNHDYTQIIWSLENDLLLKMISQKRFLETVNNLKYFFNSRHITKNSKNQNNKFKFTIITNFTDISQDIPFPFNYYYLYQRDKFQKLISIL